jgi:hypothetical protein
MRGHLNTIPFLSSLALPRAYGPGLRLRSLSYLEQYE